MILVRQVYHLKFGYSNQGVSMLKEMIKDWMPENRAMILTDVSGRDFTVVLEGEFESLASWEQRRQEAYQKQGFAEWFERFQKVVETSYTEIYNIEYSQM